MSPLESAVSDRLIEAFSTGTGHGLFHLGAVELGTSLPPVFAFWREFGHLFLVGLCALSDVEEQRAKLEVECPREAVLALVDTAPPMKGGEYLSSAILETLWDEISTACRQELAAFHGSVQEFLKLKNPLWNLVGRVHFHLAEQKRNEDTPFAFLATYTTRVSRQAKVQHLPLGRALTEFSGARNKSALLSLLKPVQAASEKSAFLKEIVDSGSIFHPLAWSPVEAYRFLKDIPAFEEAGVVVRVPDWWKSRGSARPRVQVSVGSKSPSTLGLDALLDFSVNVVLGGERLTDREWKEILSRTDGLALIKGQWVEIDRQKLKEVLAHWKAVEKEAAGGLSFLKAMRLLSGASLDSDDPTGIEGAKEEWTSRVSGPWLTQALEELRERDALGSLDANGHLKATLRPYQREGVTWLHQLNHLGLGACLADDMGLGKTLQILALLLILKQDSPGMTHLLVVPASLISNWKAEIDRFAPGLKILLAHPSALPTREIAEMPEEIVADHDAVITSYGYLSKIGWASSFPWGMVVLDEAQTIKNPQSLQTRTAKAVKSRTRVALTGTPVENRLSDLWSIFDFINPGLLGSIKAFSNFTKELSSRSENPYAPLRKLVRPYILRRLKTDRRVITDLPDKTELKAYCALTRTQAVLYEESVTALAEQLKELEGIQRKGVVLAFLTRFKQICNHPSQWLGDSAFQPSESGKFSRLREICEVVEERQDKVLIFTQYREMTRPLGEFLSSVFGRPGLILHGEIDVKKRRGLVERFQDDETVPFFVLSLKAGGTGLNLTAASHVVHFDRWWNPAVENQATDRAFRIGQKKNVLVHKFVCRGTVEEKIDQLLESKIHLSSEILEGGAETLFTELPNDELLKLVALDIRGALDDS